MYVCVDWIGVWSVNVVAPDGTGEVRGVFVEWVVMVSILYFECFRPSFEMMKKSSARSILDCICGMSC